MRLVWLMFPAFVACGPPPTPAVPVLGTTRVVFETTTGTFEVGLYDSQTPVTVENFIQYVEEGFYDGRDGLGGTVFHRAVNGFVVQGGGFVATGEQKITRPPIVNEASMSRLSNVRGTLSMARTNVPDSATSQFFVNLADNLPLDAGGQSPDGFAVFGEVVEGMAVIDAMGAAPVIGETPIDPVEVLRAEVQ